MCLYKKQKASYALPLADCSLVHRHNETNQQGSLVKYPDAIILSWPDYFILHLHLNGLMMHGKDPKSSVQRTITIKLYLKHLAKKKKFTLEYM